MRSPFEGVGVALATLFAEDGSLDLAGTVAHAERVVEEGLSAVVVSGSTGEAPALTIEERASLVRELRAALPARIAVVAGTGDVTTAAAVTHTREAVAAGADAVMALSPLRVGDPRPYYGAVTEAAEDVAVLAYHFPAMSPPGIDLDLLDDLGVAGVKDSSGDAERLLIEAVRFRGALYTGAASLVLHAGAIGCTGAILAVANLEPALSVAAFAGDREAQLRLLEPHLAARSEFPRGLKRAMAERFGTSTTCRMG